MGRDRQSDGRSEERPFQVSTGVTTVANAWKTLWLGEAVALDPTGQILASGSFDYLVRLWEQARAKVARGDSRWP